MKLKMILPGGTNEIETDMEVFSLANIKSKQHLDRVDEANTDELNEESEEDEGEDGVEMESDSDNDDNGDDDGSGDDEMNDQDDDNNEMGLKDRNDKQPKDKNPLLVDLEPEVSLSAKANMWFGKDVFKGLEDEADEDLEISQMVQEYKKQGAHGIEKNTESEMSSEQLTEKRENESSAGQPTVKKVRWSNEEDSGSDDSDSDNDEDVLETKQPTNTKEKAANSKGNDFEVVPVENNSTFLKNLTAETLALGHKMAFSRKNKRDIIDAGFHRWAFNDENLPTWFTEDETKHYQRQLPVSKETVADYKARMKEINARPVKKVAEAKARKKRKEMKRLEKARKKAEAICDTADVSEKEKMNQIKSLYKKAALKGKPKEVKYVVAKKSQAAKRMKRPAGVKGLYKIVDPRMKKDLRSERANNKRDKKKGNRRR